MSSAGRVAIQQEVLRLAEGEAVRIREKSVGAGHSAAALAAEKKRLLVRPCGGPRRRRHRRRNGRPDRPDKQGHRERVAGWLAEEAHRQLYRELLRHRGRNHAQARRKPNRAASLADRPHHRRGKPHGALSHTNSTQRMVHGTAHPFATGRPASSGSSSSSGNGAAAMACSRTYQKHQRGLKP